MSIIVLLFEYRAHVQVFIVSLVPHYRFLFCACNLLTVHILCNSFFGSFFGWVRFGQPAESLALLVSFLKSGLSEKQIIKMLSIFSCIGPVGECLPSLRI